MIIPEASPVVYSPMSLVELVRGAISSTQQQNTAAILQTIIGSLDRVLCPMYARRHKPDADVLPLDRRQHGEEESDEVKQESQSFQPFNFNLTQRQVSKATQIQTNLK